MHDGLQAWNGLLQVYGALYLPVIFAMLFELNLDAWVSARINYEVSPPPLPSRGPPSGRPVRS